MMNTLQSIIRKMWLCTVAIVTIVASLAFTSCNSDNGDPSFIVQEYATFTGSMAGKAVFEVQRTGNGPVYTLTSSEDMNLAGLALGSRVLVSYQVTNTESLPTGGAINVVSFAVILSYSPKVVDMDTIPDWDTNALYMEYASRTGGYINIMSRAYVNASDLAGTFTLYVDESSLSTETPQLYLRYNKPAVTSNEGRVPMSLDIRQLWNQTERFDGVTLHVNNSNMTDLKTLSFPRSAENYEK